MEVEVIAGSVRWVVAVALLVCAARRWVPRILPGGPSAPSEAFLRVVLVATFLATTSVALLGVFGLLAEYALLALALALWVAARIWATDPAPFDLKLTRRRALALWPLGLAAGLLVIDVAVVLPTSPVNWDAMTYHLYFPARWIQEGRLFHIPTVFSDNSSAYAPQNGALFFAWQMALLGRDATTNVSQVLCLAFLAVAVYRIALLLGIGRVPALMAATLLLFVVPLRRWTLSANVDVFMLAFWVGSVYWLMLYAGQGGISRRQARLFNSENGSLLACALATGLALGTKTLALPLALIPAGLLVPYLAWKRRFRELLVFTAVATAAGGWWFLKNLWFYGNPFFPLDFGPFRGVYTVGTLRQGSPFHVEELGRWLRIVTIQVGLGNVVFFVVGIASLISSLRVKRVRPMIAMAVFALAWPGYVFAIVPHNNQARFLLPSLVAASLGWAIWLDTVRSRRARALLFLLGLGALCWASRPDLGWAYYLDRLHASASGVVTWLVLAVPVLVSLVAWVSGWERGHMTLGILLGVAQVLVVAVGADYAARSRIALLAQADFSAWASGYLLFNEPYQAPHRIAYSGLNIPYALSGSAGQHVVFYCNTQGEEGDGLYEFWRRDPRLHPTRKPGLYRGEDDFDVWWSCLERRRIDAVVLFATVPVERPPHWKLSEEFPIEREWMRRRPEVFRPILIGGMAEIYEVTRPVGDGGRDSPEG